MDTTTTTTIASTTAAATAVVAAAATNNPTAATVQHVTKKSSDELLRKFAEVGDDDNNDRKNQVPKRRRRISNIIVKTRKIAAGDQYLSCESPLHYNCNTSAALVEKRSLLLPVVSRKSVFLRQLGIGRSQLIAKDIRNKSILVAIEKTWRKTLEGASKVLLEKHYNRHRRLISDVV